MIQHQIGGASGAPPFNQRKYFSSKSSFGETLLLIFFLYRNRFLQRVWVIIAKFSLLDAFNAWKSWSFISLATLTALNVHDVTNESSIRRNATWIRTWRPNAWFPTWLGLWWECLCPAKLLYIISAISLDCCNERWTWSSVLTSGSRSRTWNARYVDDWWWPFIG